MAVLHGYFDDSGTHDHTGKQKGADVIGVAGYVATVPQWAKFDMAWRRALKEFGVPPQKFHAFDLQWKKDWYHDWSKDREQDFVQRLTSIIDHHTMFGMGGFVLAEDFAKMPQAFRDEVKHPFFLGLNSLLHQFETGPFVGELRKRHVNFFFERMKPFFEEEMSAMFSRLRDMKMAHVFGQITMGGDKKTMLPLHAADLAAYHVRAEISRLEYKPHLEIRHAMDALKEKYRLSITYMGRQQMRDLYFRLKIERALIDA